MFPVRTRIAPSPTGENLHIGNAYTALINYVIARQSNGQFIIRIEDTDRTRLVEGSEKRILESLHWLGITHDEGPDIGGKYAPYRQSDRLPIYTKYVKQLISSGHAYYCFCTPERLDVMRKNQEANHQPPMYDGLCKSIPREDALKRVEAGEKHVVRLNVPDGGTTIFHDVIRGDISFENKLIDDQVLLKSDGYPTYHLGVVVDDHLMGITHVIRGEEWTSSTPKHILLYEFFGWDKPVFAHVSVLRNPDKSKLSKRKNPVWVSWFRQQGFLPEAILNFLATMAWSYPGGREIFSLDEMIASFKLEDVQTTAPVFNTEKLRWMNGEYLRKKSDDEIKDLIYAFHADQSASNKDMVSLSVLHEKLVLHIIPLVKERMKTVSEFWSLAGFFFQRPIVFERPVQKEILTVLSEVLRGLSDWTHESLEHAVRNVADAQSLKAKDVFMELRLAVTGKTVGPPLLESLLILGKEEALMRLSV